MLRGYEHQKLTDGDTPRRISHRKRGVKKKGEETNGTQTRSRLPSNKIEGPFLNRDKHQGLKRDWSQTTGEISFLTNRGDTPRIWNSNEAERVTCHNGRTFSKQEQATGAQTRLMPSNWRDILFLTDKEDTHRRSGTQTRQMRRRVTQDGLYLIRTQATGTQSRQMLEN